MAGLIRKVTMLSVLGLIATSVPAFAQPSPVTSITPAGIRLGLVGAAGGVVPPGVAFSVTVNDPAGVAMPGIPVIIDFDACTPPDIRLSAAQPPQPPVGGPFANTCAVDQSVSRATNAVGTAAFELTGAARSGPFSPFNSAAIWAVGAAGPVLLAMVSVAAYDLDGVGGIGATDFAVWATDFFSLNPAERSDFNGSGSVTAIDLAIWASGFFSSGGALSAAPYCAGM